MPSKGILHVQQTRQIVDIVEDESADRLSSAVRSHPVKQVHSHPTEKCQTMNIVPISANLSVAGQLTEAEIARLRDTGTALLINNRPAGEEPGQPSSDAERSAAHGVGVRYLHQPVVGAQISHEDVRRFREAVQTAAGPVVAHCRSGTRSLTLWVIGEVLAGHMRREEVMTFGIRHGIDLSGALTRIDQLAT
jgi:uncharacterized protein (TIGR01244 family)